MLALTSPTGKLGHATLSAILSNNLIPPSQLVLCTSSPDSSLLKPCKELGVQFRTLSYTTPTPSTFEGCTKLFLISSPDISFDCGSERERAKKGGREGVHVGIIKAAVKAGVREVVYTSLAFGSESGAGVMRAHLRTEEFLQELGEGKIEIEGLGKDEKVEWTVVREGLYNESWPLYLGYFDPKGDLRDEVVIAGDGKISWTSIPDLGLGNALILADETEKWRGKTIYLSHCGEEKSLADIAALVSKYKGREIKVKKIGREEYVEYYDGRGEKRDAVEWWSTTYEALERGECVIEDRTLDSLLDESGVRAKGMEETVREMLA